MYRYEDTAPHHLSIEMPVQDANWQDQGQNSFEPSCEMFQGLLHRKRQFFQDCTLPVLLPVSRRSVAETVEQVRLCLAEVADNTIMGLCNIHYDARLLHTSLSRSVCKSTDCMWPLCRDQAKKLRDYTTDWVRAMMNASQSLVSGT